MRLLLTPAVPLHIWRTRAVIGFQPDGGEIFLGTKFSRNYEQISRKKNNTI